MSRHRSARIGAAAGGVALLVLLGCATAQSRQPAPSRAQLLAAFGPSPGDANCQFSTTLLLVDQRLVYSRRVARACSDGAGGALYDGAPERVLCTSGGILPAPRCDDERWRALFLQLEAQRDLARAALPGHEVTVLQAPGPSPGR
ncbi:hypothetical protein JOD97_004866 [Duganella sp. 1411]|uniref:hypothetical protein n=1 Tax=Duganella sp. 1411 TaxID=2806572 RepID=UPI001AE6AB90|nr:hypothetical protein [Duganella sp. 1411]MBP1206790.1 hypothetical protein [Duganella sp. 1411]